MVAIPDIFQFKSTAFIENMMNQEALDRVKTVSVFYYAEANISVKQIIVLQRQLLITETGEPKNYCIFSTTLPSKSCSPINRLNNPRFPSKDNL
jgi:hypothetical protein